MFLQTKSLKNVTLNNIAFTSFTVFTGILLLLSHFELNVFVGITIHQRLVRRQTDQSSGRKSLFQVPCL
jgi:hypothetical protein